MEFRTYFVYFHTFSYKFKVQRTPTEFELSVFLLIQKIRKHNIVVSVQHEIALDDEGS